MGSAPRRERKCGWARAVSRSSPSISFDLGVAHRLGVGAAASRVGLVGCDLGLDVAANRGVREHRLVDRAELAGADVEPVEVAVEDERGAFASRESENRFQGERVAVEPAHDVERLRLDVRRPGEDGRRVAVMGRTRPAGLSH
jgi:hypothetical protein